MVALLVAAAAVVTGRTVRSKAFRLPNGKKLYTSCIYGRRKKKKKHKILSVAPRFGILSRLTHARCSGQRRGTIAGTTVWNAEMNKVDVDRLGTQNRCDAMLLLLVCWVRFGFIRLWLRENDERRN
jgi:hypothetical protein